MKNIIKISLIATLAILVSSCCTCRKGSPEIGNLEKSSWKLVELQGKAIENSGIELKFDAEAKMMYGKAPCNNFFGGYSLFKTEENNIKIAGAGATMMMCMDVDMTIENTFTSLLSSVTKVKIDGKNLLMSNAQGDLIAVLTEI